MSLADLRARATQLHGWIEKNPEHPLAPLWRKSLTLVERDVEQAEIAAAWAGRERELDPRPTANGRK